jgi:hypothetical protein
VAFAIIGPISQIETIASGEHIRELRRLRKHYGGRRWRKRKGIAMIRLATGEVLSAEIHWYECHGVGRVEEKIKRILD